jgi:hypothetical protein
LCFLPHGKSVDAVHVCWVNPIQDGSVGRCKRLSCEPIGFGEGYQEFMVYGVDLTP